MTTVDLSLSIPDQGLEQLFTALKNLDLMERTILVILSDHGQAFGEHGLYATRADCHDEAARMVLTRWLRRRFTGRAIARVG